MEKCEYVPKRKYQPFREDVEEVIKSVQDIVRKKFTFIFILVEEARNN